jgi:rhomboid protease GluP
MVIIAVTIGVWLLHEVLLHVGINTDHTLAGNGLLGTDGQWWRLVTPVVVHFGLIHIAFNMAWVYQLGPPIERILGKVAYVATYLATAVAGNVCSDLFYFHKAVESGGASGAVYGLGGVLVGAYAMARWLDRRRTGPPPSGSLAFNDQAVRSLGIFFGAYLLLGTLLRVDTAAHFGGGVLGMIIGAFVAWHRNGPRAAEHAARSR